MRIIVVVLIGFLLDMLLGDPRSFPHPVRLMGWLITKGEKFIRGVLPKTPTAELIGGAFLTLFIITSSFLLPFFLLQWAARVHPYLRLALESIFCYQIMAAKSLKTESTRVYDALAEGNIDKARHFLSMIVGRDTQRLDESHIVRAAVETVAENTSDGVIAPLLFVAVGGAPLGFFYKAVNTLDSMIGYKNEKYLYFGRFAAKLDDLSNYLPARISAGLMMIASFLLGLHGENAWRIYRRDRKNHASPNSAHTESVCAGALGVELAGDAYYFGKLVKKPTIGDGLRPIAIIDIRTTNRLMYATAFAALFLFLGIRLLGVILF